MRPGRLRLAMPPLPPERHRCWRLLPPSTRPLLADEGAVPVAELTSLQRGLVACLRSYYDELAARNLIEADEAADLLASMVEDGGFPPWV